MHLLLLTCCSCLDFGSRLLFVVDLVGYLAFSYFNRFYELACVVMHFALIVSVNHLVTYNYCRACLIFVLHLLLLLCSLGLLFLSKLL